MKISNTGFQTYTKFDRTNSLKNNKNRQTFSSNENKCNLPGYNVSFGMAKITHSKKYPGAALDEETRNSIYEDVVTLQQNKNKHKVNKAINNIKKQANSLENTRYIISLLSTKRKNDADAAVSCLREFVDNCSSKEKKVVLTDLLFNATDRGGSSLFEGAVKYRNCQQTASLLEITRDYPNIQLRLLTGTYNDGNNIAKLTTEQNIDPDDNIIKKMVAAQMEDYHRNSLCECLNSTIYNLAARNEDISIEDSIRLLETNMNILDYKNREVLEILQENYSDDSIIIAKSRYVPEASEETPSLKIKAIDGLFSI